MSSRPSRVARVFFGILEVMVYILLDREDVSCYNVGCEVPNDSSNESKIPDLRSVVKWLCGAIV